MEIIPLFITFLYYLSLFDFLCIGIRYLREAIKIIINSNVYKIFIYIITD